jgi:hypothetical protein
MTVPVPVISLWILILACVIATRAQTDKWSDTCSQLYSLKRVKLLVPSKPYGTYICVDNGCLQAPECAIVVPSTTDKYGSANGRPFRYPVNGTRVSTVSLSSYTKLYCQDDLVYTREAAVGTIVVVNGAFNNTQQVTVQAVCVWRGRSVGTTYTGSGNLTDTPCSTDRFIVHSTGPTTAEV